MLAKNKISAVYKSRRINPAAITHGRRSLQRRFARGRSTAVIGIIFTGTAISSVRGQAPEPIFFDVTTLRHQPSLVTTKAKTQGPVGVAELTDGKVGKALKLTFIEPTGPQLFTAWTNPTENWDEYAGFSFWVKGDGSKNCGGLELIDGQDSKQRYGYCFPINSTNWIKITVPWRDLTPELAGSLVDPKTGYAPSKFRNLFFGKWFYWREFPACTFTIDHMVLEKRIAPAPDLPPQPLGLARFLAKLKAQKPVTIVTMGDSLSDQRHWANRTKLWSEELVKQLKATYGSEVNLVNPAIGGTTLSQNLVLIPRWLQEVPAPDLVTIWFGYNDWDSGVRGPVFKQYLRVAVERIRQFTHGQTEILLLTSAPCYDRWVAMDEMSQAVREIAQEQQTGLADIAGEFHKVTADAAVQQNYFANDKVHLGAKGHELTKDFVFHVIATQP